MNKVEYEAGRLSRDELRDELDELWAELASGSLQSTLEEVGLEPDEIATLGSAGANRVTVDQPGEALGEAAVIIVAFAPTISHFAQTLWDEVLLPRIKTRRGSDALGRERPRH